MTRIVKHNGNQIVCEVLIKNRTYTQHNKQYNDNKRCKRSIYVNNKTRRLTRTNDKIISPCGFLCLNRTRPVGLLHRQQLPIFVVHTQRTPS